MKPGVFTQLYTQLGFAPKYRERLLKKDHIHILIGLSPNDKISDLVGTIKKSSSTFINEKGWFRGKFHWQDGYGAFSYGKSQLDKIYNYVKNQESHHKKRSFREEYIELLKRFEIEYDEKYLFKFFE